MLELSNEREVCFDALNAEKVIGLTYIAEDMPLAESKSYEEQSKEMRSTGGR